MKSLIVYGPKGCGKTTHAEELMRRHGLTRVIEVDGRATRYTEKLAEGVLFLTNARSSEAEATAKFNDLRVMSYENAMRTVSVEEETTFTGKLPKLPKVDWKMLEEDMLRQPRYTAAEFNHQWLQTPSPTFQALDQFMGVMAQKLQKHKLECGEGWHTASANYLKCLLHVELQKSPMDMVDIANYAMMIWTLEQKPVERKAGFNPVFAMPYGQSGPGLALATGTELDYYGRKVDLPRLPNETDESYRYRIQQQEGTLNAMPQRRHIADRRRREPLEQGTFVAFTCERCNMVFADVEGIQVKLCVNCKAATTVLK